jgi:hypothetical protein
MTGQINSGNGSSEAAREDEFKRKLADEIDEAYVSSRIDQELLLGLRDSVPPGHQESDWIYRMLGCHTIGKLVPAEAVPPQSTTFRNIEERVSTFSPEITIDRARHSPSPDDNVELLRQRVGTLEITAPSYNPMSRCGSFSESEFSSSSILPDISDEEQHPNELLGFHSSDIHGIEELSFFRTNRLRCQIYAILWPKVDRGEIHASKFLLLAE